MNPNHFSPQADQGLAGAPSAPAAGDAARQAGAVVAQQASRFGELARQFWQRHANSALDTASTVRQEALVLGDRTGRYVRDEPMRSLLVAAAAGALIGVMAMWFGGRDRH